MQQLDAVFEFVDPNLEEELIKVLLGFTENHHKGRNFEEAIGRQNLNLPNFCLRGLL